MTSVKDADQGVFFPSFYRVPGRASFPEFTRASSLKLVRPAATARALSRSRTACGGKYLTSCLTRVGGPEIEAGLADAVIAGGADTFADMPLNGFHALGVLAGERTRPLTDHRPGITIGEGAGLMLLTRRPSAVKLSGWGESSDGHHMSSPEPEGRGAEAAVRGALSRAGLTPDDIVYVNLHGTGTGQNDASELAAMNRVFGGRTAMSSTKTYTGHTLGAAGVTDAGLLVLGLMHGGLKLPAQFSEGQTPDETLPLSGVLREPALIAPGPVMSTNLAFGGSNTALIFEPTS